MNSGQKGAALLLLAAGQSARMGENKLLLPLLGRSVLERALNAALAADEITHIIIVASEQARPLASELAERYTEKPISVVSGGATRQESAYLGLLAAKGADIAAIHDAARCLVSPAIIDESVRCARKFGSGVVALAVQDTIKRVDAGVVRATLDRSELVQIQTPQTFACDLILRAHEKARSDGFLGTDDSSLAERLGESVRTVAGSAENIKLTTQADIGIALGILARRGEAAAPRAGFGEDTHRLVSGRRLILGGVDIPFDKGLLGHSDADALTHAVMDALLGAAALPDIGELFPDTDAGYEGASSIGLLRQVAKTLESAGFKIGGVDAVVVAQNPKLAPYKAQMRQNIAAALGVPAHSVNVKATTTEGLGKEGRGEAITARAVAVITQS